MKNKISSYTIMLNVLFLLFSSWSIAEEDKNTVTALYLIGSKGEYISQGRNLFFKNECGGKFAVFSNNKSHVYINFNKENKNTNNIHKQINFNIYDDWNIDIQFPKGNELKPGIFQAINSTNSQDITFSFFMGGRGSGHHIADFEILEIEYDGAGKIQRFAADFILKRLDVPYPLHGAIRYNSALQVSAKFKQLENYYNPHIDDELIYLIKPKAEGKNPEAVVSMFRTYLLVEPIKGRNPGVSIFWSGGMIDKSVFLEFGLPQDSSRKLIGHHTNAFRYPFSEWHPEMEVVTAQGSIYFGEGEYKILRYITNANGSLRSLAINFKFKNIEGELLEGAVRYHSTKAINWQHPFEDAVVR